MNELLEILRKLFSDNELDENTELKGTLAVTSLNMVGLIMSIEDAFGVTVRPKDMTPENFASPSKIMELVERLEDE